MRADFHLHTIAERDPSRTLKKEFSGETQRGECAKAWVAKLVEGGVRVGVITNHNMFDAEDYRQHMKLAEKEGIMVLPGVELNVFSGSGIHTLIVFHPDWGTKEVDGGTSIDRFLSGQFPTLPDTGTRSRDNLRDCLAKLEDFKNPDGSKKEYFVIFAHVQSSNGLMNELEGNALGETIAQCGELWPKRVLGLQRVTNEDALKRRWPREVPIPAFVQGSDPMGIEDIGREPACFLKIGELSFDAVRFALHDHIERVRGAVPPPGSGPRLAAIRFTGGALNGAEFPFSPEMTALIGSRGSGKSAVIECLRYGLDLPVGEDDRYKNKLVEAMLANGGELTITGSNTHGQAVEIRRPLGFNPKVYLEGKETRLRPQDVFPDVLYFGQKDLGHRGEQGDADFFAKLSGPASPDQRAEEERRRALVQQAVQEHQSVLRAREKDDEFAQEEERLRHELALYQERGVEQQLQSLTSFDADKRSLTDFIERLREFRGELAQPSQTWRDLQAEFPRLHSEVFSSINERLGALSTELGNLSRDSAAILQRMDALLTKLEAELKAIGDKERELQEQFAAIQRDINAPDLDLQQYRQKRARFEQLGKLRQAASNRTAASQQTLERAVSAALNLHELWRSQHTCEAATLEERRKTIPQSLTLKSEFEGDREAFKTFLKTKLRGTGFREVSCDRIVETFPNGIALHERRAEIPTVLGGSADVQKLEQALATNLADFLTFRVPPRQEILFEGTPIQELSLGKRATALLTLVMALESHPIILIDQPEDDLDNETIFKQVVAPLLRRKTEHQFIIATHNPNLPVLGDAELVHACREEAKGTYRHSSGSIDSQPTRHSIVKIMEGGEAAFEQRQKIYRQWSNSPFAKNS